MVHMPRNVRPVPANAVGSRSIAPANAVESLGVGLPSDMSRNADKPVVKKRTTPRKRALSRFGIRDKVSLADWDINPFKIIEDM